MYKQRRQRMSRLDYTGVHVSS